MAFTGWTIRQLAHPRGGVTDFVQPAAHGVLVVAASAFVDRQRRRGASGMHNSQFKELFERIEIAIAMQERMLFANAERRNEAVDRLAYGATAAAQETIVSRSVTRQLNAGRLEYL